MAFCIATTSITRTEAAGEPPEGVVVSVMVSPGYAAAAARGLRRMRMAAEFSLLANSML
jgi:hypothetical protein